MQFNEAVALVVRHLRREHNISQEKLAELINSHQVYICEIEQGKKLPSLNVLNNIAQAFHIPLSELVRQIEEKLQ
ncbi:MAG: helix-turn-helix transcriptional regulator [Treponema sp.]|jgi:transcriptional regulator with XRE-family HTH domain|nr:helix-turn-helix domain-containing protein [Spirochaetia bacterium]MDD7275113.1 helix-turn-helix transcriptional regulator [Treponema sp.]MDY3754669.1 helix-turn-helix transcriptional regulator [Treponema sp.]